jgi:hypothetical protein
MANQEQLDILKQGVEVWNKWREENSKVEIDLSGAELRDIWLNFANFQNANLIGADFSKAFLDRADFSGANLTGAYFFASHLNSADFYTANLSGADLPVAYMNNAYLVSAHLIDANLFRADLGLVDFRNARLNGADLTNAKLFSTNFGAVDLSKVEGLEKVIHEGPSTIGIDTIYLSQGNIPEAFLKGAGVDDTFITYIRSLVGKPIEYYSCFISYSSKDEVFAKRLYADLQSHNVRCWFAPEDLKWGERIRSGIDEAIRIHDKLLLILSKSSVASGWVEREVKAALAKERNEKRTVLFPVRVDRAVFESPFDWATEIRHERNIGDFTGWKDHDEYEKAFSRLLHDLKAEA